MMVDQKQLLRIFFQIISLLHFTPVTHTGTLFAKIFETELVMAALQSPKTEQGFY